MDELQKIRKLVIEVLYYLDQLEGKVPSDGTKRSNGSKGSEQERFAQSVNRALAKLQQDPYSPEELAELYELSGGDAVLVGKLLFRSSRKGPDLKPYVLNAFRKYGAEGVRAWFQTAQVQESPEETVEKIVAAVLGEGQDGAGS